MVDNKAVLDALEQDVQNESSAVDAAVVLINGLVNRLTELLHAATGDEDLTTRIQSLRYEVNQRSTSLAQAVADGTAAENDSSNFPASGAPTESPTPATSDQSTGTTSSDTSGTSDATPAPDTSAESGNPVAPAGDGTADTDLAPPSAADITEPLSDSPPAVETEGDEAVADEEDNEPSE